MWGCSEEVNHNKTISAIFETDLPQKTTSDLKYTPLCLVKDPPSVGGQNKPLATCTIHTCPNDEISNCMQCPCSRQQTTHTCTQTACNVHVPTYMHMYVVMADNVTSLFQMAHVTKEVILEFAEFLQHMNKSIEHCGSLYGKCSHI